MHSQIEKPSKVPNMPKVKVALIGVGNCASAFIQGIQYYGKFQKSEDFVGLRNPVLAGLSPKDIEVVAAFDVDDRKVGKDLSEAIFAMPNNAPKVADVPSLGVKVSKGPLLDGLGKSSKAIVQVSNAPDANVVKVLKDAGAEVMVNLLAKRSHAKASQWYAEQAIGGRMRFR